MTVPKEKEKYTYSDYLYWPENEHWEIINGDVWNMSPAPGRRHQEISKRFIYQIEDYLKDKKCKVYNAPFDVRFPNHPEDPEDKVDTVVQPDLLVVCDDSKLDEAGCKGVPDWIIEILSPYTAAKDLSEKYNLYEDRGVKEYWVVDPLNEYIAVFLLNQAGKYIRSGIFNKKDKLKVHILEELIIDLESVFRS